MKLSQRILIIGLLVISGITNATEVKVNSLKELANYGEKSGNTITMSPGVYPLTDYLTVDSMIARHDRKAFQYITFTGSNNVFNLAGVEIEVDTELRTALKPPIHSDEFLITGKNNTFNGLTIRCVGNGISPGGTVLQVAGAGNVLKAITLHVAGAYPYGYGDLFGKGKAAETVIKHSKHSGLLVTGSDTKLYGCKLYNHSFGHCFFVQRNAENVYFEDCYAEGAVRTTDDILAETSGPAFDVKFRTWTQNREGEYVVTPGYMKSLCEDGFRIYGAKKNLRFKNCTAKNTRAGFELRSNTRVILENCTAIGCERAYWVGDDAIVKNCKGDANYGPLMFVEGSNVDVELILDPAESDRIVHALVTIQGENNKVILKSSEGKKRQNDLPILIGYTHPMHGESMSPYDEGETIGLKFRNETGMPLKIGEKANNCEIQTDGEVLENKGTKIKITKR
jgi:parallel beta-helix repeat protein